MSIDMRERYAEAAARWALMYPIASWRLAEDDKAELLAKVWGEQIALHLTEDVRDEEIEQLRAERDDLQAATTRFQAVVADIQRCQEIADPSERMRCGMCCNDHFTDLAAALDGTTTPSGESSAWQNAEDWHEVAQARGATIERARTEAQRLLDSTHPVTNYAARRFLAALDAPETPEKPDPKVPDRIDYDSDGELDDVFLNHVDAHLERMNDSRWYLGLYGDDGRIVQIDIASKTGRAEVTGLVKYSEGVAPDLERWAKTAPETPGDEEATDA